MTVAQAVRRQPPRDRDPARLRPCAGTPPASRYARPRLAEDGHRARRVRRGAWVPPGRGRLKQPRGKPGPPPMRGQLPLRGGRPDVTEVAGGRLHPGAGDLRDRIGSVQHRRHRAGGVGSAPPTPCRWTRRPAGPRRPAAARCHERRRSVAGAPTQSGVERQGRAYSTFVENELKAERERRVAFDARGASIVTSSGALVTLLAGVVTFLRVGTNSEFPRTAFAPLAASLPARAGGGHRESGRHAETPASSPSRSRGRGLDRHGRLRMTAARGAPLRAVLS